MQQHDIWVRFIEGDDSYFNLLYKEFVDPLFRYGIQFTANEELVKDAIHDVFIQIYNKRKRINKHIPPKFYLFKTLKNYLFNFFKREALFFRVDDSYLLEIHDSNAENKIFSDMELEERKEIVFSLLQQLTDRQREAIYYRYVEELSMKEIAVLMNMNAQSVQNIVQRSLEKMRSSHVLPFLIPNCVSDSEFEINPSFFIPPK